VQNSTIGLVLNASHMWQEEADCCGFSQVERKIDWVSECKVDGVRDIGAGVGLLKMHV